MFWLLLFGTVAYFFYQWVSRQDPPKMLGVYGQVGKWYLLKFHLMKWIITRRQRKSAETEKVCPF